MSRASEMESLAAKPSVESLPALTGVRGAAALWVLLGHLFDGGYLHFPVMSVFNPIVRTNGYPVDLFFMLSGFILMHVYGTESTIRREKWYLRFLNARLARIYPAYLVAILCVIIPLIAGKLAGSGFKRPDLQPEILIPNLLLIQNWGLGVKNIIMPCWAISMEWFAYLFLFPVGLWFFLKVKSGRAHLAGLVCLMALVGVMEQWGRLGSIRNGEDFLRIVTGFGIGVCLYGLRRAWGSRLQWTGRWSDWIACALVLALFFRVNGCAAAHEIILLLLAALLLSLSYGGGWIGGAFENRFWLWMGALSYSLYLVHDVVMHSLFHFYSMERAMQTGLPVYLATSAVNLAASFAAAVVLYHLVEEKARHAVRKGLDRLIG